MKYVVGILIVIILILGLSYWNSSRQWDNERSTFVLNDSLLQKRDKTFRDSANRELVQFSVTAINKEQLLMSKSAETVQLQKDLAAVNTKLKNVNNSTSVASSTHDTVRIPVDRIITKADTGIFSIPFSAEPDTFLSLIGESNFQRIDSTTFRYNSVKIEYGIKNNATITYYNETRFLEKAKLKLLITQTNPHTSTGKVQTYYIKPDKKWYQKFWVHAALGSAATIVAIHYLK